MKMSKPRKKAQPIARERILDTAFMLFAEQGLEGTTTKQIAVGAKVNEVTLFRIFGSKEALFQSVIGERSPLSSVRQNVDFNNTRSFDELLLRNAQMVLANLKSNKHFFQLLVGELWRHPELSQRVTGSLIEEASHFLAKIFQEQMDKRLLRPMDALSLARAWIGFVQSYFLLNHLLRPDPPSPKEDEEVLRSFVAIFLDGTRGERG